MRQEEYKRPSVGRGRILQDLTALLERVAGRGWGKHRGSCVHWFTSQGWPHGWEPRDSSWSHVGGRAQVREPPYTALPRALARNWISGRQLRPELAPIEMPALQALAFWAMPQCQFWGLFKCKFWNLLFHLTLSNYVLHVSSKIDPLECYFFFPEKMWRLSMFREPVVGTVLLAASWASPLTCFCSRNAYVRRTEGLYDCKLHNSSG